MEQDRSETNGHLQSNGDATQRPANGSMPSLSGDLRPLIPTLGLRNYWYPAISASKVSKRKPVQVRMLGEDLCFFRGESGNVVALTDICPHRGARLSEGHCHFAGTVACPYHGWVYNERGENIAVLSEGPNSRVCGKPGTEAKIYPSRELHGVVFVWIGEDEPAPIEQDVPEEFFDPDGLILHGTTYWDANWEIGLENSMDSHVNYLHRNALLVLRSPYSRRGATGEHTLFVGNGFSGDPQAHYNTQSQPPQDVYPELGWKWPKHQYRRGWTWLFRPFVRHAAKQIPTPQTAWWGTGHRLPGMFRAQFAYDLYTRQTVPVEEHRTRLWYFHYLRPKHALHRAWRRVLYYGLHKWLVEYNFSRQDMSVMTNQRYDTPEKLSGTDAEVIQWRRLVVTKHLGGRDAAFEHRNPDNLQPEDIPISRVLATPASLRPMKTSGE
ncbi:MAG: aromatic ring-hydroxylating dioxygenase subunit alpha [Candidatus Tectomicrobia bacterium]|nr:aromatic ring-hydroxylating dioxygenase subunit alpha [Candidatus Tectomicrobia bacterium]